MTKVKASTPEKIVQGGFLSGKKTYIVAFTGILGAVAGYLTGEAGLVDTFQIILTALLGAGLREGVSKK